MTASTTDRTPPWVRFLFRPQSTSPMTLVRIGWGATATLWAISLLPDVDPFFVKGDLLYDRTLSPGAWNVLPHLPGHHAGLIVCLVLLVASVATTVGWRTRASSLVAVLMMVILQRANTTIFNSGDLLLRQVGVCVALAPCGLLWSLDARRDRRKGRVRNLLRSPFAMRFLQLSLALGYFLSAWAKARGTTWHDGTAIGLSLRIDDLQRYAAPDWLFEQTILLNLFTWATLLFEASFAFLVWNRRLRPWVIATGIAFHLGIDAFLDIGFFSMAIFLAYVAFVPEGLADRIVGRFDSRALGPPRDEPDEQDGRSELALVGGVGGTISAGPDEE